MSELSFREKALQLTRANTVKARAGRTGTYLQKFVEVLEGKTQEEAMTRVEIIAEISADIAEQKYADVEGGFDFENQEHLEDFAAINRKVKNQVSGAISNSNNNTSLSYNPAYKDKFELMREKTSKGEVFWLVEKDSSHDQESVDSEGGDE